MDDNSFDASLMNFMFSNAYKMHKANLKEDAQKEIKDDLTEKEAIDLADELLQVLISHNLSYKNTYRVSLALTAALAMGGIELFDSEEQE